ncbi:MAG: SAF domain-containing protein [Acidipropionibacterium sp.]|jgi:Flp pilus assembly protein CpaB|nr:SAF domain-containing protein [Acidipropionibacterium sp.]
MPLGRALHVAIARHRRGLAALLVAAAVWLIAHPGADEQAATVPALTAARPLSGGSQITDAGLAVVQVPSRLLPAGALDAVDQAAGQTLVADRPRGAILTRSDLLSAPRAGPGQALTCDPDLRSGHPGHAAGRPVGARGDGQATGSRPRPWPRPQW